MAWIQIWLMGRPWDRISFINLGPTVYAAFIIFIICKFLFVTMKNWALFMHVPEYMKSSKSERIFPLQQNLGLCFITIKWKFVLGFKWTQDPFIFRQPAWRHAEEKTIHTTPSFLHFELCKHFVLRAKGR